MTQPDPHQSLALFRDRLLMAFLFLPDSNIAADFSSSLKRAGLHA